MASLAEAAERYARRGRRIFPVKGKYPAFKAWQHLASCDPTQVAIWWMQYPDAGIALRTGTDLVVVDIDGEEGADALHELEQSYHPLPRTVESLTPRGRHLFFRAPFVSLRSSASVVGPGIDVRGEGGFVVLPPSVHPSGKRYEWSVDGHPSEVQPAVLPPWLEALARPRRKVRRQIRVAPTAGQRNMALTSLAGSLVNTGLASEGVRVALHAHNRACCDPPLTRAEVDRIADSAGTFNVNG